VGFRSGSPRVMVLEVGMSVLSMCTSMPPNSSAGRDRAVGQTSGIDWYSESSQGEAVVVRRGLRVIARRG
jgi:hypothetical protein